MDFGSSCLVGQKVCDLSSVSLSGLSLDVGGGSRSSGCWEGKEGGMGGIASNVGRRGEVGGAEGGAHSFKCWGRKRERWRVGLTAPNRIS